MKIQKFDFYSTIATLLLVIMIACVAALLFGSCTRSTHRFIDDNEPIGPYHIGDPSTVFDQNIDVIVYDKLDTRPGKPSKETLIAAGQRNCSHDFGVFPEYSKTCKKCGVDINAANPSDYSKPCDHFFVSRCIPIEEWDEAFQSTYDQSPKDCICIYCKKTETCY